MEGRATSHTALGEEAMNNNGSKRGGPGEQGTLVAARAQREDVSRFESEGGRTTPEQRTEDKPPDTATWKQIVLEYQTPSTGRALWQTVNTLGPYALLWYLMYLSLPISWWLAVPLAVLAAGFHVRVFIIHHDCGHGSFFKSRKANDILGFITGVLTFTPYHHWRWEHAAHHATSGDLDRRGMGDIWTLTVLEYLEASRWKRFAYRLARNPFILFVIAPLYLFLIRQRFPSFNANKRERHSVYAMNLAVLGMAVGLCSVFGIKAYL